MPAAIDGTRRSGTCPVLLTTISGRGLSIVMRDEHFRGIISRVARANLGSRPSATGTLTPSNYSSCCPSAGSFNGSIFFCSLLLAMRHVWQDADKKHRKKKFTVSNENKWQYKK